MALVWHDKLGKPILVKHLEGLLQKWRDTETIVCASGHFNPAHRGHLQYLDAAKHLGTKLIVIVNNDVQVGLKQSIPFMGAYDRCQIVAHLRPVDLTISSLDLDRSVNETLSLLKPHIFANGGDVADESKCREAETCRRLGIRMVFGVGGTEKICSSSELIRRAVSPK